MFIADKSDKVYIPQTEHTICANDYNQIKNEIQNAIELAGLTPEKDVIQLPQALRVLTQQSGAEERAMIEQAGAEQLAALAAAQQTATTLVDAIDRRKRTIKEFTLQAQHISAQETALDTGVDLTGLETAVYVNGQRKDSSEYYTQGQRLVFPFELEAGDRVVLQVNGYVCGDYLNYAELDGEYITVTI